MKYPEWYRKYIEEPVRDIVYILRNNGFNTTCSCGHNMTIEIDMSWDALENLYNCLAENWGEFYLEFYWEGHQQFTIVSLGDKKT